MQPEMQLLRVPQAPAVSQPVTEAQDLLLRCGTHQVPHPPSLQTWDRRLNNASADGILGDVPLIQ